MYEEQLPCTSSQPMQGLVGSNKAKSIGQTENQLIFLGEQVKRLSTIISDLEMKLNPILRSQESKGDTGTPEPVLTSLAGEIRKIGNTISYKAEFLRDIIDRLEL